jgi:hypothetical protein
VMGRHEQRHSARSARAPAKTLRGVRVLRAWALAVGWPWPVADCTAPSLFGTVAGPRQAKRALCVRVELSFGAVAV